MEGVIEPRDIVWAKLSGFPWWPGFVERVDERRMLTVVFFGDGSHACLPAGKVRLWASCPELPARPARHSRLSSAIAIARECVEASAREHGRALEDAARSPPPAEPLPERKATLATADTLETSRQSTLADETGSQSAEPFPAPSDAQALLERNLLAAAHVFVAQRDHHARRCVEGGLDRLEQDFPPDAQPSPALCSGLARLWLLCEQREDPIGACLLKKALRRLARLVWARFLGGEEAAEEPPAETPSSTAGGADARQARRVSRKIAKAVAGFALQKPLPKRLCQDFAQRFEHLLAEAHPSPHEYRSAVLSFLENARREPRAEMMQQFEKFPEIFEGLPLKDYFNLQF